MTSKEKEDEKLYFTEITENEKRIINLIRTYIAPLGNVTNYVDMLVDNAIQDMLTKTVKLQAFVETMQNCKNKGLSDINIMARMLQYEKFISNNEPVMKRHMASIVNDILENLEGDIKPIEVYSPKDMLEEEEKTLDKTLNQ